MGDLGLGVRSGLALNFGWWMADAVQWDREGI